MPSIAGISTISEVIYDYDKKQLRMYKHYGKGEGECIPFVDERLVESHECKEETAETPESTDYEFWISKAELRPKKEKRRPSNTGPVVNEENRRREEIQEEAEDIEENSRREVIEAEDVINVQLNAFFPCPENNCIKRFRLFNNLEQHIRRGDHKFVPEKKTLYDDALHMFVNRIEQVDQERTEVLLSHAFEEFSIRSEPEVKEGFCIRRTPTRKRFSAEVHEYIDEQLETCIQQQKRLDAKQCEKDMAAARQPDGKLLFSPLERLNSTQIASLVKRKLDKLGKAQKQTFERSQLIQQRDEINEDMDNETGEAELEYEDDPMFQTAFDAIHEEAEANDLVEPVVEADILQPKIKRRCRKR